MSINQKIFRAYDMRGIYPEEINEQVAYLTGRALVCFLSEEQSKDKKALKIVVSRDGRLSSPELFKAVTKGITEQGASVVDIGLMPTPVFYFSVWFYNHDGGIQITASHNPPEYNGFKLNQKDAKMIAGNTGIDRIKELVLEMAENEPAPVNEIG
ncbi:MAG: hypothetical protein HQ539_02900, partial [Parcubacteria group bacterium]|nr:hypothetical protein [Parcubacteria group bacterium]